MKRLVTAVLLLTVMAGTSAFSAGWKFAKVFPDTGFVAATGVHGIAVDKAGKVWLLPFGKMDTVFNGVSKVATVGIYAFNPDGTPAAFNHKNILSFSGVPETLYTGSWRGARADKDGNVVLAASNGNFYKVDPSGNGIAKVKPNGNSTTAPCFTDANEMFTANVAPGNPVNIYGADFSFLGNAIASSIGFSRSFEVSKDGNNIYWAGYTAAHVKVYHSDLGTLGTYALVDSFAFGCQAESFGWNKKDGYLYISSGPIDTIDYTPPIPAPYSPEVWYGWNPTTKTVKDSIVWNKLAYKYPGYHLNGDTSHVDAAPRPRGIAFSVTGDTAYVATYNYSHAAVQMFTRNVTSVEPTESAIPNEYKLSQNYPNPFNPTTEIAFSIQHAGMTSIRVFDMLGREVATLVNENLNPGSYKTSFNASRLSSGTYVYQLTSGSTRITKKMMLIK